MLLYHHNHFHNSGDSNKYIITFFFSLAGIVVLFILNIIRDNYKIKKERKEKFKHEVIGLCDKIIKLSISAENATILNLYWVRLALLYKDKGDEMRRNEYSIRAQQIYERSNNLVDSINMLNADITKYVSDLYLLSHDSDKKKIKELMKAFESLKPVMHDPNNYPVNASHEEITKIFESKMSIAKSKHHNRAFYQPLTELKELLNPLFFTPTIETMQQPAE